MELQNKPVSWLNGGGEMSELIHEKDWSETLIGSPDSWPQSLRTTLGILLKSRSPMFLWWGEELIQFYNDAYRPSLGNSGKHPAALGQRGEDCWPEIWPTIKPLIYQVFSGGESVWQEDQLIPIYRNGKMEDVYWTFGYSAVSDENGNIAGVLVICNETTEKIKHLLALQKQEKTISNIFSQAPVAVAIFKGPTFIIELANEKVLEFWGRTHEQVINKPLFEALPEAAGQGFEELLTGVFTTGDRFIAKELTVDLMRKGKLEKTFISFVYEPYHEIDGSISGIVVLANEITEQVLLRKKVEESEHNLRSMILQSPVAMCIFKGPEYIIEISNDRMLNLWGTSADETIGKPVFDVLPETKESGFDLLLDNVFNTGQTYKAYGISVPLRRNGIIENIYVDFVYEAFREIDGSITGVMAIATEVTEQVLNRKKLEESEYRFRSLVNEAIVAIALYTGKEMKIEFANETMIEALGKGTSVIGKTMIEAMPEFKGQPFFNHLDIVYSTGETFFGKEEKVDVLIDEKMQTSYYNYSYKALKNSNGEIYGILNVGVNVTEQVLMSKKIEEDVREQKLFSEELEKQVLQRTSELVELNRNLQHSNENLEQFASLASHDLQEPLRKIQTFTLLLEQRYKNDIPNDAQEIINKINKSSQRMSFLIRDVLNYSHITQPEQQFESADLNEILKNVLTDLELQVKEKNIIVNAANLPTVDAIPVQINQLFYNLLSNSIKFSKQNVQPVINVNGKHLTPAEVEKYTELNQALSYCEIIFADNGIGFNQQFSEEIFLIFHRLNDSLKYSGTGIGLALCKKIVDAHHGKIFAESSADNGAAFYIILPCKQLN